MDRHAVLLRNFAIHARKLRFLAHGFCQAQRQPARTWIRSLAARCRSGLASSGRPMPSKQSAMPCRSRHLRRGQYASMVTNGQPKPSTDHVSRATWCTAQVHHCQMGSSAAQCHTKVLLSSPSVMKTDGLTSLEAMLCGVTAVRHLLSVRFSVCALVDGQRLSVPRQRLGEARATQQRLTHAAEAHAKWMGEHRATAQP